MKKLWFFAILLTGLMACNKESTNTVNLRIANLSGADLQNIQVNPSGRLENYGDLRVGEVSLYKAFDIVYSYAYIRVNMGDEVYVFQPIDYVGEVPLENGNYTYELSVVDKSLSIRLKED